jgi:hypothetical protein
MIHQFRCRRHPPDRVGKPFVERIRSDPARYDQVIPDRRPGRAVTARRFWLFLEN